MNFSAMDIDPLGTFEYPTYNNYEPLYPYRPPPIHPPLNPQQHPLPLNSHIDPIPLNSQNHTTHNQYVKVEQQLPVSQVNYQTNQQPNHEPLTINEPTNTNQPNPKIPTPTNTVNQDVKPSLTKVKKEKKRGRRSTYWSEKIDDATFPFYTCAVCDINFLSLQELDTHVTIHKDRMTSYRLRLINQNKKKLVKKEKKKLKKQKKIKKEVEFDIEIKPEDGYIGNEKASDYNNENIPNRVAQGNGTNTGNEEDEELSKSEEQEMKNLEKIYKCYACKKQFMLSYYLKLHVRSHTDEKPYTCSVCGQSFITASKLTRHNKRIHLASRFQCRICFKVFVRFELLTTHFDKKHADDKLEGEPYDYNAILPYLKELEEQLKVDDIKDVKPKTEDMWWVDPNAPHVPQTDPALPHSDPTLPQTDPTLPQSDPTLPHRDPNLPQVTGSNEQENYEVPLIPESEVNKKIIVEDFKISYEYVKVKTEVDDDELVADDFPTGDDFQNGGDFKIGDDFKTDDHFGDGVGDDKKENTDNKLKDENDSDEDYFPSKTWLSSPKIDLSPPSPTQRRRKKPATIACEVCHKKFSSASYMRIHMRTHTGEKPFKCFQCGRGFITSGKLHRHILAKHMEGEEVKTEDAADIKEEAEENGDKGKTKKSPRKKTKYKCLKKIKKNKKVEGEKVKKKYQKRPHACEFCHQKFLHQEMLQVHKKIHEGETLVLRCQFCLTEVPDQAAQLEHEASHTGPKPYMCTVCGKCYKKRETMVYHKKHHKPDKEFICDVCSKRFNAACKLAKHLLTHRADKFVLRYECPVCAHMFNTKYHIQMHLATHQKEGLILEENRNEVLAMVLQNARKIPKQADAPANLTDIIPSDERSRICNICGEIFHHFYYLEEHLKSHGSKIAIEDIEKTEEKKYICPVCNKGFKLHYYLKLHSFTHSKEKPFICQQCGKGFITKGKLKRHLETHTGLKKYQCHICCKFFTRPSYLRIHIRTIHGTQDYNFRFDKGVRYDKGYGMAMPLLTQIASDMSQNSV